MINLVAVPLCVAVIVLSVANRQPVTLTADPFRADPSLTVEVPLYLVVFAATAAGAILGRLFTKRR